MIVAALKPVKIGLEEICSRNATLLNAEGVFSFVIRELNKQNSEFAKNMKYSLVHRINERRNVNLIGLMRYLNFGRKYEAAAGTVDISRLSSKNCLRTCGSAANEEPECRKVTIHLQTSMSSPGFEPRPNGIAVSVVIHNTGWATYNFFTIEFERKPSVEIEMYDKAENLIQAWTGWTR
ncbi:uncharacterized protein TNCV_4716271 [Trichonephila clavipes]|nr:uncharacterized protein TNCV_4716271 [Trichonephila clavipes]